MNNWNIFILIVCVAIGVLFIWRERKRPDKHWLWGRLLATIVAVTGMAGMGLYILKKSARENQSLNITDSLHTGKALDKGFLTIHWPQQLKSGEPLIVQGKYANANTFPVTIVLNGFSTDLDSVVIASGTQKEFVLNNIPKQKGKTVFRLMVRKGTNIIENEPLPVVIRPPDSISIFILSSHPDFENKFLSQWMAENHYRVVQRTRISRDRNEHVFLNCQPFSIRHIDDKLLERFDLLISDAEAFGVLSSVEQHAILHQIDQNGMGLLIRADSVSNKKYFFNRMFPGYHFTGAKTGMQELVASDSSWRLNLPGGEEQTGIRFKEGTQPLLWDKEGRILVSSYLQGGGRIIFSTVNHSYVLALGGKDAAYGLLWSRLIGKSAKTISENVRFWTESQFPRENNALEFNFEIPGVHLAEASVGSQPVNLHERKNFSSRWYGSFWPEHTGWQPAIHITDHYFDWYVYEQRDWGAFMKNEKSVLPKILIRNQAGNQLYFFIFFMSGWLFLWIERKLSLI